MIRGLGLDVIDIGTFRAELDEKEDAWIARVFTATEQLYCRIQPNPYMHFAGTMAAKEAALKALGTGWTDETDWQDVELIHTDGRPTLSLKGSVEELSCRIGVTRISVSISYANTLAAAVVILES